MQTITRRIIRLFSLLLIATFLVFSYGVQQLYGQESTPSEDISDTLVKIYTTESQPEYYNPWAKSYPSRWFGSGCIIAENRILTNAHNVADQTYVEVQRNGQDRKFPATVLFVSHDADLAVLTVEEQDFFEGVTPLRFGDLPNAQDEVLMYGFPAGGDRLSITSGIVSRIEYQEYVHSSLGFLSIQVDAATNPGNSGGPVIKDGKIVGIVMQANSNLQNTGYMVPTPLIDHFLTDIEDERYDGFPYLGMAIQTLESPDLKRKLQLDDAHTGVLVRYIIPGSPVEGIVQEQDVLLRINDQQIFDDGTIELFPKERIWHTYLIDTHQIGDTVKLYVFRSGQVFEVVAKLTTTYHDLALVPLKQYDRLPRYVIFGGIVFSPLTQNLILEWGEDAPEPFFVELSSFRTPERHEVVVALHALPAEVNTGYHGVRNWIVHKVNGHTFKDFEEFYHLIVDSDSAYVTFEDKWNLQMVIDRQKAQQSHAQILRTYDIKAGKSPDLR